MDPALNMAIRIAAAAVAFGLTVLVHELGHFLGARLAGMTVYEFSIGFGRPLLFSFKRGDTQYSFRFWQFLSYVRIAGMEPDDNHPRGFSKRTRPAQAMVLSLGSVMNFLLAVAIFVLMGTAIGMPVTQSFVGEVFRNTPAQRAGLRPGDRILGVNGRLGLPVPDIQEAIRANPATPIVLEIERDGKRLRLPITPRADTDLQIRGLSVVRVRIGLIGIGFGRKLTRVSVARSVKEGFLFVYDMVHVQVAGIIGMFAKTVPAEVMGPVGMAGMLYHQAKQGWTDFLWTFALLTVAVGFLNLLPIPPLDGSRLAIVGIEGIRRKPFDKRKEFLLHLVGFALFLCLAVLIAYQDIVRILERKLP